MKRHLHVIAIAAIAGSLAAGAIQSMFSAYAVQNELVPPTAGIFTGPAWSQKVGDGFRSLASCNKGPTAPANVGGVTVDGLCWIDDSGTPWKQKRYVNGGWAIEGFLDPTTSTFSGVVGGGVSSITSAATTDLGSVPSANVTITGTATISSFGSSAPTGVVKFIRFSGAATLTHSSSLTVPGGFPLVTAANDRAIVTNLGSGNWEITQYTRDNGVPVDLSAVGKPQFTFAAAVPPLHARGNGQALTRTSFPAYLAKVTRVQNGTRISGNATITGIADTTGFSGGMPVEGTGIAASCTISATTTSSITLNSGTCVTASGTAAVTVFLTGYGSGGSTSTVGVPDCRGRTFAGRDNNDPGTFAGVLSSTFFGNDPSQMAIVGGSQSHTLAVAEVPSLSFSGTTAVENVAHSHQIITPTSMVTGAIVNSSASLFFWTGQQSVLSNSENVNHAHAFSGTTSGGGGPHSVLQPTMLADCIVRVTP